MENYLETDFAFWKKLLSNVITQIVTTLHSVRRNGSLEHFQPRNICLRPLHKSFIRNFMMWIKIGYTFLCMPSAYNVTNHALRADEYSVKLFAANIYQVIYDSI